MRLFMAGFGAGTMFFFYTFFVLWMGTKVQERYDKELGTKIQESYDKEQENKNKGP